MALDAASSGDREIVAAALRQRGFLAPRLRARAPLDQNYQANALVELLESLYGRPMPEYAIHDILTGCRHAPTEALLIAACQLARYEDVPNLLNYFLDSYARSPEVGQNLREGLARLGYGGDRTPIPDAPAGNQDIGETQLDWAESVARDQARSLDQVHSMRVQTPDPQGHRRGPSWAGVVGLRGKFSQAEAKEAKEAKKKQQDDAP
jgi:hypothetical protein